VCECVCVCVSHRQNMMDSVVKGRESEWEMGKVLGTGLSGQVRHAVRCTDQRPVSDFFLPPLVSPFLFLFFSFFLSPSFFLSLFLSLFFFSI